MDLQVSITPSQGGHRDLRLEIPSLGVDVCADTYYFAVALENLHETIDEADVRRGIVGLLDYWLKMISTCGSDEVIYLPFDFSDQYTGRLQVTGVGENFCLSYGYSLIEGWRVNPLEPGNYCRQVSDFKAGKGCTLELARQELSDAVESAIAVVETRGTPLQ